MYSIKNYELLTPGTLCLGMARICVYVKDGVGFKRMVDVENNGVNAIALELENFIIVGIYKLFKQINPLSDNLDSLLDSLKKIGLTSICRDRTLMITAWFEATLRISWPNNLV